MFVARVRVPAASIRSYKKALRAAWFGKETGTSTTGSDLCVNGRKARMIGISCAKCNKQDFLMIFSF